jgi:hypothetical protein
MRCDKKCPGFCGFLSPGAMRTKWTCGAHPECGGFPGFQVSGNLKPVKLSRNSASGNAEGYTINYGPYICKGKLYSSVASSVQITNGWMPDTGCGNGTVQYDLDKVRGDKIVM